MQLHVADVGPEELKDALAEKIVWIQHSNLIPFVHQGGERCKQSGLRPRRKKQIRGRIYRDAHECAHRLPDSVKYLRMATVARVSERTVRRGGVKRSDGPRRWRKAN